MVKMRLSVKRGPDGAPSLYRGDALIPYAGSPTELANLTPGTEVNVDCTYVVGRGLEAVVLPGAARAKPMSLERLDELAKAGPLVPALSGTYVEELVRAARFADAETAFRGLLHSTRESIVTDEMLTIVETAWSTLRETEGAAVAADLSAWWQERGHAGATTVTSRVSRLPIKVPFALWTNALLFKAIEERVVPWAVTDYLLTERLCRELDRRASKLDASEIVRLEAIRTKKRTAEEARRHGELLVVEQRRREEIVRKRATPPDAVEGLLEISFPPELRERWLGALEMPVPNVEFFSDALMVADAVDGDVSRGDFRMPVAFRLATASLFALEVKGTTTRAVLEFALDTKRPNGHRPCLRDRERRWWSTPSFSIDGAARATWSDVASWLAAMAAEPPPLTEPVPKLGATDERRMHAIVKKLKERKAKLHPPLAEAAIDRFERWHTIRLPAAYREFLLHVANGVESTKFQMAPLHHEPDLAKPFRKARRTSLAWGGHLPVSQEATLVVNGGKRTGLVWIYDDDQDSYLAPSDPQADFLGWLEADGQLEFRDG